jgi:hypothetical protein
MDGWRTPKDTWVDSVTRCQKNGGDRRMQNIGITARNLGNRNCRGHGPNMGCHATAATALLLLLLLLLLL